MPYQVRQDKLFGHFVSDILGLGNAHTSVSASRPAMFGSFGANLLHLGNVDKRVYHRFRGLQTFHVKHI